MDSFRAPAPELAATSVKPAVKNGESKVAEEPKLKPKVDKAPGPATCATSEAPDIRKPLKLHLKEVELEKLHKIDYTQNSFQATIWVPFVIEGGALDPTLTAPGAVFPMEGGRPTFKPSAEWFLKQVDSRNALSFNIIDSKTLKKGDDLILAVRIEGIFTELYELHDFPFTCQGLTLTININCRCNGPMPVVFVVDEAPSVVMTCIRLCPPDAQWSVSPELYVRAHEVGWGDRAFPAISFTTKVSQKPFYPLIFLAAPFGMFSLIAVLTGATRAVTQLPHRAQLTLMIVMIVATYRIAISSRMPPISYLTTLDKYVISNMFLVLLVAVEARVVILLLENGLLATEEAPSTPLVAGNDITMLMDGMTSTFDIVFIIFFNSAWVLLHTWFISLALRRYAYGPVVKDENLKDSGNRILDKTLLTVEHGEERSSVKV